MASDEPEDAVPAGPPVPCSACRGTGIVISSLGGGSHEERCPWCDGAKVRLGTDHDAQAHWPPTAPEPADEAVPAPEDAPPPADDAA